MDSDFAGTDGDGDKLLSPRSSLIETHSAGLVFKVTVGLQRKYWEIGVFQAVFQTVEAKHS